MNDSTCYSSYDSYNSSCQVQKVYVDIDSPKLVSSF